jgi:tetratricopeptide (TPR) repeat protein
MRKSGCYFRCFLRLVFVISAISVVTSLAAQSATAETALEQGYHKMYNLDFAGAQGEFSAWERAHPEEPTGPVSEAAGLLFSEFNRLGILESQFFVDDAKFDARRQRSPDAGIKSRFDLALKRAEAQSQARLSRDPQDRDAMFAMAMCNGLRADYAALIEKRNVASLSYTREATRWADKLLALSPDYYDAYLATGIGKYIVGSMAAPVRWILRLGGYAGNKQAGISELQLAAQRGHYLAPFAQLLLAIAYLREKDFKRAREVLVRLQEQFPANTLFPREIARLDAVRHSTP